MVLVDSAPILMTNTQKNQAAFLQQSYQKPGLGFPIVRLFALIPLATGTVIEYHLRACQDKVTGETSPFSQVLYAKGNPMLFLLHANTLWGTSKKADFDKVAYEASKIIGSNGKNLNGNRCG